MTTPDLAAIVRGLTKAQRETLQTMREPDGRGKWPARNALVGKGLFQYHPWCITPLGFDVRAHLTKSQEANDDR